MINKNIYAKNALIVMTKNPVLGQCKTRLAKTIGDKKALEIYIQLLNHTAEISKEVQAEKFIYSTGELKDKNRWESKKNNFKLQSNGDLGKRMNNALETVFNLGYQKVVVIGSDCAEMNATDLQNAFNHLTRNDIVVGPAVDGGYYLIGMKKTTPPLFQNMKWSTSSVFEDTISKVKAMHLSYALLPEKSDIDKEEDLKREGYVDFK